MATKKEITSIILILIILILSLMLFDQYRSTHSATNTLIADYKTRMQDVKFSLEQIYSILNEDLNGNYIDSDQKQGLIDNLNTVTFTTQDLCNSYDSLKDITGDFDINNNTAGIANSISRYFEEMRTNKKFTPNDLKRFSIYKKFVGNWIRCFKQVEKLNQYTGISKVYAVMEHLSIYSRGADLFSFREYVNIK